MQQVRVKHAFTIHHEANIYYDAGKGIYTYVVNSSRDISEKTADTAVMFNANSGDQSGSYLPTGEAVGDTITEWLVTLHMARVWGLPMQIFVSAMGLGVVGLTITGVFIWLKKRSSRKLVRQLKTHRY